MNKRRRLTWHKHVRNGSPTASVAVCMQDEQWKSPGPRQWAKLPVLLLSISTVTQRAPLAPVANTWHVERFLCKGSTPCTTRKTNQAFENAKQDVKSLKQAMKIPKRTVTKQAFENAKHAVKNSEWAMKTPKRTDSAHDKENTASASFCVVCERKSYTTMQTCTLLLHSMHWGVYVIVGAAAHVVRLLWSKLSLTSSRDWNFWTLAMPNHLQRVGHE